MKKFQLCIAGKNQIAVNVLQFLLKAGVREELLVCPIRDDDGVNSWQPSLRYYAIKNNIRTITIQQAQDIGDLVFISLEYDCLIRPHLFSTTRLYNLHFSALPQFKGMYTSSIPILLGSRYSGVTIHEIDRGIDTGPIVSQLLFDIEDHWSARDLYYAYMSYGFLLFKETFSSLISEFPPESTPQNSSGSSYFSKKYINYSNLSINLFQTAEQIVRQLRAFTFREYQVPVVHGLSVGAWNILDERSYGTPGSILERNAHSLLICTVDYNLLLTQQVEWEWFSVDENSSLGGLDQSNIDITDKSGLTPLMYAAQSGNYALCSLLLSNGANPNKSDLNGRTPLMVAEFCQDDQRRLQTIELLINYGAHHEFIDNMD